MLERVGEWKGKAWRRSGEISVPGFPTTRTEQGIENFPDQIEFSEVWDDWSGGFGYAYRTQQHPNTVHWSENFDTRFPGQAIHTQELPLLADINASANTNAEWFMDVPIPAAGGVGPAPLRTPGQGAVLAIGRGYAARFTPISGLTYTRMWLDAVDPLGGRPALYGTFIYAGSYTGTSFIQIAAMSSIAQSAPAGDWGTNFVTAGNRMWRSLGSGGKKQFHLRSVGAYDSATVLSGAQWSATLAVGDGMHPILDMTALQDQIYLGTPRGVLAGDQSGTFNNIMPDIANVVDFDNCRDLAIYDGQIIAQAKSGVFAYYPSPTNAVTREISPAVLDAQRSPVTGYVRALKGYGAWLYAGMFTGSRSYLLAGRQREDGFAWHVLNRLPHTTSIHRIHFDSMTRALASATLIPQRMWIATDASFPTTGTAPVYVTAIPKMNGDPLADTSFSANYSGSARMDLGAIDRGAPGVTKVGRRTEIWAENLASGAQYADVYYTLDRGTRTLLGRAQESPVSYLYFPSTAGSFTLFRQMEISLESFTASLNTTPVYRSVVLRGAILADVAEIITAQTRIADNMKDRSGTDLRPGAVQINELRQWASPSYGPIPMIDLLGNTNIVKVLPPIEEFEVEQDGDEEPQISATVRMAIMSFTSGPPP